MSRPKPPPFPNGRAHLVSAITVPDTARPLDDGAVAELAESIKTIGLLHPLVVRERTEAEGWRSEIDCAAKLGLEEQPRVLVSGHRRLAAVQSLGWTHVPVIWLEDPCVGFDPMGGEGIDLEAYAGLVEAHENLVRSELTAVQCAHYTDQAKRCYLTLHPETGHGGDRSKRQDSATCSFVESTARATGKSPRAVRDDARAGAALRESPEAKAILETAPKLPQSALLEVAKAKPEERVEVAKEVVQKAKAPKPKRALHPKVASKSKATKATVEPADETASTAAPVLSDRDQKIHDLYTASRTTQEIAKELGLSVSVVQTAKGRLGFVHHNDNPLSNFVLNVKTATDVMGDTESACAGRVKGASVTHISETVEALDRLEQAARRAKARLLAGTFGEDDEDDAEQATAPAPLTLADRSAVAALSDDARAMLLQELGAVPFASLRALREQREQSHSYRVNRKVSEPHPGATDTAHVIAAVLDGGDAALALLGLDWSATPEQVKAAYHKAALIHHPDKPGGDGARMADLNDAYRVALKYANREGRP